MGGRIHIAFRKWPDSRHWQFEMDYLGEDEHGMWLWGAPGWVAQRGHETPKTMEHLGVKVITDGWWTAIWGPTNLYVDIVTPAVWDGDRVTMIDLDLDVGRRGEGEVEIYDEDEFLDHQVTLAYPADIIAQALSATAGVVEAVETGREPFGKTARMWMEKAQALSSSLRPRDTKREARQPATAR